MFEVKKPFNGAYRRHRTGDRITGAEDIGVHTVESLMDLGFIEVARDEPAKLPAIPADASAMIEHHED